MVKLSREHEEFRRSVRRTTHLTFVVAAVGLLLGLAFNIGLVYVAIHFTRKFW